VSDAPLVRGSAAFRRANRALFAAGFATYAVLYCVQPLLPVFATHYDISPAESSLCLSLTTLLLGPAMVVASSLSEAWGRKPVMTASLLLTAVLTLAMAAAPGWGWLLAVRALIGITLSGLPAVSMAYLAEEIEARSLGYAMGLFIAGSAVGGMLGRVVTAAVADHLGWPLAIAMVGVAGLVAAAVLQRALPASRHFRPRPLRLGALAGSLFGHVGDQGLPWLFAAGFLLMGSFVTVYNYSGFRLLAPPFALSQTAAGAIFTVYVLGMVTSPWIGSLVGRLGRRKVLWATVLLMLVGLALTLAESLVPVATGIALFTVGFFGAHTIASSWVGRRARQARAQASALYLSAYYLGGSLAGWLGGLFWADEGWPGVALLVGAMLLALLAIAIRLVFLAPLPIPEPGP
jgi:YNFM family putative membrane transporter